MELKLNFFERKEKSIFSQIAGVFYILVFFVFRFWFDEEPLDFWDLLVAFFGLLAGCLFILQGRGFYYPSLWGRAYVDVDENEIIIKTRALDKERKLCWDDLDSIKFLFNGILFLKKNGETEKVRYSDVIEREKKKQVESVLTKISQNKNIEVTEFLPNSN